MNLPIAGVQEYRGSGVQEFGSTGVQEYQMSGNSIIIMSSPVKVVIMNRHCNTGVIVIQLGVTTSGRVY